MFKNLPSSFAIMAALFAALGTLFFVVGTHTFYRNCQFAGNVERIEGIVTNRHITVSRGRHGSSTNYHLGYQFRDTGENTYIGTTTVTSTTYYGVTLHGAIPVKYLPKFPKINRIDLPAEDSKHRTTAWAFMLMGGLLGGCGWYFLIELEGLIFCRRWLRKFGIKRTGSVNGVEINTPVQINCDPRDPSKSTVILDK